MKKAQDYGFTGECESALKKWPKDCGPRVTQAQLDEAASLLKRHGTGKMLGLAMILREGGATQNQVMIVTGDTQVNVVRDLVAAGKVRLVDMPGTGRRKVYRVLVGKAPAKRKPRAKKAVAQPTT